MEWEKDTTIEFIDLYKTFGVLWYPKHPLYFNKIRKQDAWEELSRIIGKPVEELKKKMESLNAGMRREKMKMAKSLGTGKGANEVYKSSWYAFNSMQFLWDKNKPRNTLSNLQTETTLEDDSALDDPDDPHMITQVTAPQSNPSTTSSQRDSPVYQNKSAPVKRPQMTTSAPSKKKVPMTDDQRLDKAFEILQSASASGPADDSHHFGNFVAAKLREYNSTTRFSIQSAIMNVFARANEGVFHFVPPGQHIHPHLPSSSNHSSSPTYSYQSGSGLSRCNYQSSSDCQNSNDVLYPRVLGGHTQRQSTVRGIPNEYEDSQDANSHHTTTYDNADDKDPSDSVLEELSPYVMKH